MNDWKMTASKYELMQKWLQINMNIAKMTANKYELLQKWL